MADHLLDCVSLPAGAWGVGVSGGADSVALLALLRARPDLRLVVLHLDHQTRAGQSAEDARFVADLARQWELPCVVALRSDIALPCPPKNRSAAYRAARLAFFKREAAARNLQGVALAHHAGDLAETVLQRLLRSSPEQPLSDGLAALRPAVTLSGLDIRRPLLQVDPRALRRFLIEQNIPWRQDASNASRDYLRNRLRAVLQRHPPLTKSLGDLSRACAALADWKKMAAPELPAQFAVAELWRLPGFLQEAAIRQWLAQRGVPSRDLRPPVVARLLRMASDAGTPSRQQFPGPVMVHRRAGIIFAQTPSASL